MRGQWNAPITSHALLTLRLSSLATNLGSDPLAYALVQLPEGAKEARPWRTQHRDLRIALPQPELRPILEPLLRDLTVQDEESERDRVFESIRRRMMIAPTVSQPPPAGNWSWNLAKVAQIFLI